MSALAAGTISLLFTDIEGSTNLLQQLGDDYAGVLAEHHRLLRDAFGGHGGIELDNAGDGFYYRFPSARAAVAAAVDAQRALSAFAWPDGVEVRVRMGLHTGEPLDAEIGLVGIDVHRTARICAAGHGGQVLLSRTARDLAGRELPPGVTLLDLGEHRLKDLADPEHIFQVVAEGLPVEFPPLRTLDDRPTNLPRRLSTFVGREQELAEGRELLAGSPLVTLTGPGGVGKTRLALQIALAMLDDLPDGVWLAELGNVTEEGLVLQAVAEALKVTEQPGRPLIDTVLEHLRSRRLCLVLDNCEHVLGACAEIAYTILRDTDTRILATSREALGVEGERVLPVPSLELPDMDKPLTATLALRSAAVRLFLDRATAAQPSFALSDQNAAAVVQLCRRLDGMPLALELAAARVRALPVEQIAARLDDRFRLLTGGSRMAVTRHQTLRATMDWSHDLLADEERAVFRRLAAFGGGGCSLAAAESVTADHGVASEDVLDILTRLVDKSLVIAAASGSEARFTMHETVRAYARDKLVDAGEAEDTLRAHRDWYLALVERGKPEFFRGPPPLDWLAVFDREQDNLRLALEWSAAESGGGQTGLRLAAGLWRYWEIRSRVVEGRLWLERTLQATDGDVSALRANALTGAGILAHIAGDYPAAIAYHEQSLAQHRELGNRPSVAYALHNLANVTAEQGDLARARELYEEAAAMTETIGDRHGSATGLIALADVISRQEGYEQAMPIFARAKSLYAEFGDRWGKAFALDSEGLAAARSGDLEVARMLHEEAIGVSREIGDERGVARSILHLADEAAREGDLTRAKALNRECLRIRRTLRDMPGTATALERLASVVMAEAAEDAAHLLGVAQNLRETINTPLPPGSRADYERCVQWLAARMGPEAFEVARRAGRNLDMDAAVGRVFEGDAGGGSEPGSPGLATSLPAPG
jgi:predicted ATPase/class 3 adenylate cyclase